MKQLTKARAKSAQLGITLMFFVQGIISTTYLPRIPELIDQINVDFATWGIIIGVTGMGGLVGLSFTNQLIARFGSTPVTLYGGVSMAVAIASFAYLNDPFVFLLANLFMSLTSGILNIALNAQAVALQNRVGRVLLGKFHGAWSLGAGSSAVISGIFVTFMPLWLHLLIIPGLAILAFFYCAKSMLAPDEETKAADARQRRGINIFKAPKQVFLLTAGVFAGVFPELCIMDWSAVFGREELHLSAGLAAVPYAAFIIAMIIGRFSIERLTAHVPIAKLSTFGGWFGAAAYGASIYFGPAIADSDPIAGLVVFGVLWFLVGIGLSSMVPTFFGVAAFIKGLAPAQVMAMISLVNAFTFMGAKMVMGAIAEGVSLQVAFILPVAAMFAAGFIARIVGKISEKSDPMVNAYPPTGPITSID